MGKTIDELAPDLSKLPAEIRTLVRFARFMDSAFTIPVVRIRVGLDAILGLLPVVGDLAGALMSLYVFCIAVRHNVPLRVLLRMALRSALDLSVGSIPGIGDLFDVIYRDKLANVALLIEHRKP
jgi:hypothetical protein